MPSRNGNHAANGTCRVATYSPGMVGFGHIRRNASIAQALRSSVLAPAIVMIAEAWQTGALPMPSGVDCVTLPALRKAAEGVYSPRFVDIADRDVMALRARVIRGAIEGFDPDVLIVDHLPLGAARELASTLHHLRKRGKTYCVLGLRDVLQDRETVQRVWSDPAYQNALRDCYDAIWIYSDRAVYDLVSECGVFDGVAERIRYTGYLDQRPRLELARSETDALLPRLRAGRLALCVVGGGFDGDPLAEAFLQAELPADMTGVVVTGPYMREQDRQRLNEALRWRPRMQLIDFLPEPVALMERADRVISMGGYNTICEILSFEKHALIVPRIGSGSEQWIRAQRMRDLGLIDVLHPDQLSPYALSEWLARDLGPPPAIRNRVDVGGLQRIPGMLAELLGISADATPKLDAEPAAATLAVNAAPTSATL